MITQQAFEIILWRSLATFLLVGASMGVVVSLLMIYRPAMFERLNRVASKWISMRRLDRGADRRIDLEQWFYRHHRSLGMLVCLGAVYVFVYFGLLFDKSHALPHLAAHLSVRPAMIGGLEGLLDAMVLTALTAAVVAMFVGLMLWLRPSALRGLEEQANRWVSVRRTTRFLDVPRNARFLLRHNRRTGWLLLLGSIVLLLLVLRALV
jgi:hypothetical protein